MKIKVSKHKLNIHYRGSPWGSRTQQHAYCLRYAHSQHTESHLGKKQPQAKIPRAFLFSQLHFNNVTSQALFYGGHLVMRSAKPGNHLKLNSLFVFHARAKAKIWSLFCQSISIFPSRSLFSFAFLCPSGLFRISKTRYRWKDLSLKKLLFINLFPCEQTPFDLPR